MRNAAESIRRHEWGRLLGQHEYDPSADALVYWFLQCPRTNRGTVYEVDSRAAFDDEDTVTMIEVLDPLEAASFWQCLGTTARVVDIL